MNVSIISTYKRDLSKERAASKKLSSILLELAEMNLKCPDSRHYISEDGVEKLRKKLAVK